MSAAGEHIHVIRTQAIYINWSKDWQWDHIVNTPMTTVIPFHAQTARLSHGAKEKSKGKLKNKYFVMTFKRKRAFFIHFTRSVCVHMRQQAVK